MHRIGRTGRAGRSGEAILFVTPRERRMLRSIMEKTLQETMFLLPDRDDVSRVIVDKDSVSGDSQPQLEDRLTHRRGWSSSATLLG